MDEQYTTLNKLINQYKNINLKHLFQIQCEKNKNNIDLIYLGIKSDIHCENILTFDLDEYKCDLISFSIEKDEINKHNELQLLKMIGFLIYKDDNIVASLEFVFVPNCELFAKNESNFLINGKFKIIFNSKKKNEIINEYDKYPGREESIYILTSVLIEDDIIKKINC
jgi:hypothetical protein